MRPLFSLYVYVPRLNISVWRERLNTYMNALPLRRKEGALCISAYELYELALRIVERAVVESLIQLELYPHWQ